MPRELRLKPNQDILNWYMDVHGRDAGGFVPAAGDEIIWNKEIWRVVRRACAYPPVMGVIHLVVQRLSDDELLEKIE